MEKQYSIVNSLSKGTASSVFFLFSFTIIHTSIRWDVIEILAWTELV